MSSRPMANVRGILTLGFGSAICLGLVTGCQTYAMITWDRPNPAETSGKTVLAVGDLAQLKRQAQLYEPHPDDTCIGKHTFTVFGFPVGNIHPHSSTPLKQSFDRAVREALTAAGYQLVNASGGSASGPVLRGEVNACWWWSYTWFWPVVMQGGENKLTLVLEGRDGTVLWKRQFSRIEPGIAAGGAYGFDLMIKWSMTKLLQDIVRETSSAEFKAALRQRV